MKKILVTGGLGFIGNNLIKRLLETQNYDIRVLDIAEAENAIAYSISDVDFIQGDIRDTDTVKKALDKTDIVVHLAADTRVMDSIEDPRYNFETNVIATFNLLYLMRELNTPYLVNASTGGAILGDAPSPVDEEMPARPLSPYGAGKLAAEEIGRAHV